MMSNFFFGHPIYIIENTWQGFNVLFFYSTFVVGERDVATIVGGSLKYFRSLSYSSLSIGTFDYLWSISRTWVRLRRGMLALFCTEEILLWICSSSTGEVMYETVVR